MPNLFDDLQPIQDQPTEEIPQPTQHISAVRLATNRENAKRSTGPRTPSGKPRSTSNSLKYDLYSLSNFHGFIHNHDIALSAVTRSLPHSMPQPDRLPVRIQRPMKAIHSEQEIRFDLLYKNENLQIKQTLARTAPIRFLKSARWKSLK